MKRELKIGDKIISDTSPCFFIAEIGANFKISDDPEINLKHSFKLIDIAVEAKADAVKFQLYRAKDLYVSNAGSADYIGKTRPIYDIIEDMELPYDWLPILKEYCNKKNIIFLCTPFDEKAVDQLEKIKISAYKIASYTISHVPFIRNIAKKGKPIILSTGASSISDISNIVNIIKEERNDQIALMQCTAKYPAPLETINLRVISELKSKFGFLVGLSDHSREPYIAPMGAVALGAKIIEKHYTTDNSLPGPDHSFAILPEELKNTIKNLRMLEKALGNHQKEVLLEEREIFEFCRRKIYAIKDIRKGEKLTRENIAVLRSGNQRKGLEPHNFEKILNKVVKKNIKKNEPILEDIFV